MTPAITRMTLNTFKADNGSLKYRLPKTAMSAAPTPAQQNQRLCFRVRFRAKFRKGIEVGHAKLKIVFPVRCQFQMRYDSLSQVTLQ